LPGAAKLENQPGGAAEAQETIAMKAVPVQEALGMVLCHDVTQIIPGHFKGPAFRRGHIVQPDDILRLLDRGGFCLENAAGHGGEGQDASFGA